MNTVHQIINIKGLLIPTSSKVMIKMWSLYCQINRLDDNWTKMNMKERNNKFNRNMRNKNSKLTTLTRLKTICRNLYNSSRSINSISNFKINNRTFTQSHWFHKINFKGLNSNWINSFKINFLLTICPRNYLILVWAVLLKVMWTIQMPKN